MHSKGMTISGAKTRAREINRVRGAAGLVVAMAIGIVGCAKNAAPRGAAVAGGRATAGRFDDAAVARRPIDRAIADGVNFLVRAQNADGSWGTGTVSHGNEVTASVPGSHKAFRVAVTALSVMALRECAARRHSALDESAVATARAAHDRGLEWLVTRGESRREEGALLYTFWANIYATQALSEELLAGNRADARIKKMAEWHIDRLVRYATYVGGWNYYDFNAQTQQPSMGPTSFGSGAGLIALWEARQAGLEVPQKLIDSTVKRLEACHLPSGAYLYGFDYRYLPVVLPAHEVPGSLGRTQVANLALLLWKSDKIDEKRARKELRPFFTDHAAMESGRKRPYPHESWFQVSGYYYYFGQYYAARLLDKLGGETRLADGNELASKHILAHQEADGSWWDYAMWDYHKPYGTAYALMALLRCDDSGASGVGN